MRVLNDNLFLVSSTTGTETSEIIDLTHMAGFCVQCVFTQSSGSLAGTLQLQASNDGLTWQNVNSAVTISGTTAHFNNVADVFYEKIRYVLTITSGTCGIFAKVNAKGF